MEKEEGKEQRLKEKARSWNLEKCIFQKIYYNFSKDPIRS